MSRATGDITITRIERIRWNEPPEPNLFRVEFGAAKSLEIRRRAEQVSGNGLQRDFEAEVEEMERASDGEFVARGLCTEGGKGISVAGGGADSAVLAGFFRCRSKGLF